MKINFQLFGGKGKTTVQSYQPTAEEKALLGQQLKVAQAYFPNITRLNDTAGQLLYDSYGTVQADYGGMNDVAQNVINQQRANVGQLQQGVLPGQYQQNMENAIRSGLQNTMGNTINALGSRGVLNSSVTNAAMNDISRNAADSVAQQYQNNINTLGNLAQQQTENATANTVAAASNQEAAQSPAINLWNASLGLNTAGNQTLSSVAGKMGTRTTTQSGGGGGFGNMLGGIVTGLAGNSGFMGKVMGQ